MTDWGVHLKYVTPNEGPIIRQAPKAWNLRSHANKELSGLGFRGLAFRGSGSRGLRFRGLMFRVQSTIIIYFGGCLCPPWLRRTLIRSIC